MKTQIEKSLETLEIAFQKLGKKKIDEIAAKLRIGYAKPTVSDCFLAFLNHFDLISNNDNYYAITEVRGDVRGYLLYSVIILNESDLGDCDVRFYGANNNDEVAGYLYGEGYTDKDFILKIVGKREYDSADL